MSHELSYTRITSQDDTPVRWLYILHGIYGTGKNWGSVARRLVDSLDGWGVVLVDLRLHGGSQGFPPPHTVEACAEDLRRLEISSGLPPSAILGHSFGGKVALVRAAAGEESLRQVWIADTTLDAGEPAGSAWRVLEIVRGLPEDFGSRDEVVDALVAEGYASGMGQWMAMNLERDGDRLRWKLDWEAIEAVLRDFFATDVWSVIENPPAEMEVHVIRALKSDSIETAGAERLLAAGEKTGKVHLHEVDAGHWLNVDNPEAVLDLLVSHL